MYKHHNKKLTSSVVFKKLLTIFVISMNYIKIRLQITLQNRHGLYMYISLFIWQADKPQHVTQWR